jgi:hypothetical protein
MAERDPAFRVFSLGALICLLPSLAFGQTKPSTSGSMNLPASPATVKVESNLVLVPVFVYDPARTAEAPKDELPCARATVVEFFKLLPTEPYLPTDCDVTEVNDLTAKDFRLFQDGAEQQIVRMDSGAWWTLVRDNLGWHMESSDTPRGRWSLSELSTIKRVPVINRDFHILGYVQPSSTSGCHSIKVKVDRPNLLVFARNQYCAGQTPSDPLYGTAEGNKLERDLSSDKSGKIPVSLQTTAFYAGENKFRVDVSFEFPWKDLYHKWDSSNWTLYARIAVMGVVRRTDGTVAARFSDLLYPPYWPTFDQGGAKFIAWEKGSSELSGAIPREVNGPASSMVLGSSDSSNGNNTLALTFPNAAGVIAPNVEAIETALDSSDPFWMPTGYETQIDVPPGEYTLQIILSDGWKLGRAETPLTIDANGGKQMAMSSIALCKRLRDADVAIKEDAAADFAPQYVPLASKGLEFIPAGDTMFKNSEALFAYFEVDESPVAKPTDKFTVQMRILSASSGAIVGNFAPLDTTPYQVAGSPVLRIARTIPIRQLATGRYRLQVRATDSTGGSTTWRAADFTIE